jgi:hypothetical protein
MGKIEFERSTLSNGLRLLVHEDTTTPLVCLNVMYDVGSRDELPDRTGFAHLFEHLMFGGSVNIPDYDGPLQDAAGTNNAWTSTDVTNYYAVVPAQNVETAYWLESDRMLSLAFTEKSLEVQRNVVIEEFRQRYLNQPYGDAWLLMRPLAFKQHPYNWATIGKEEKHIAEATMDEVKAFFHRHYLPKNAVLVLAGNIAPHRAKELAEKWFGTITKDEKPLAQPASRAGADRSTKTGSGAQCSDGRHLHLVPLQWPCGGRLSGLGSDVGCAGKGQLIAVVSALGERAGHTQFRGCICDGRERSRAFHRGRPCVARIYSCSGRAGHLARARTIAEGRCYNVRTREGHSSVRISK